MQVYSKESAVVQAFAQVIVLGGVRGADVVPSFFSPLCVCVTFDQSVWPFQLRLAGFQVLELH